LSDATDGQADDARDEGPPGPRAHRAGFVALVGPPNAGKSTLLNRLLGEKLAIVTAKPQTTRSRILGILHRPDAQVMWVDTPGLHTSTKKLNEALNAAVEAALVDCDVAVMLVDRTRGFQDAHVDLLQAARKYGTPVIVVATKSDLPAPTVATAEIATAAGVGPEDVLEISALTGEDVNALVEAVVARLPESPPLYGPDELTDKPLRFLCAELVREAAFEALGQELPYSMAVEVLAFDESNPERVEIHANLLVARDSQKRIVVGKGGAMVKRIGTRARSEIEKLLGQRCHLELFVKVDPKWLKSARRIESLGYV
jgi:GTP-binding protein Era